jgi:hypothetical protein
MPHGVQPAAGWPGNMPPQNWNPAPQPAFAAPAPVHAKVGLPVPPALPQHKLTLPPPPACASHEALPGVLASAPAPSGRLVLPSPAALGIKLDTPGAP